MAITKNLNLGKSNNGVNLWAPDFVPKQFGIKVVMTADVELPILVPNNVDIAIFRTSAAAEIQVSPDSGEGLATTTPQETSAVFRAPTLKVTAGSTIYLLSNQADIVYITFQNTKSNLS